jgi:hypothetical protein
MLPIPFRSYLKRPGAPTPPNRAMTWPRHVMRTQIEHAPIPEAFEYLRTGGLAVVERAGMDGGDRRTDHHRSGHSDVARYR